jgi:hypothetical protein
MYVLPFVEHVYEHVPVAISSAGGVGAGLGVVANAVASTMAAATIHLVIGTSCAERNSDLAEDR